MIVRLERRILTNTWPRPENRPQVIEDLLTYNQNEWSKVDVDVTALSAVDQATLKTYLLERSARTTDPHLNTALKRLDQALSVHYDPEGEKRITNLKEIPAAIRVYANTAPHGLFFKQNTDNIFLPYLITDCKFQPATRGEWPSPAQVHLTVVYYLRGKSRSLSFTFYQRHIPRSAAALLASCGLYIENAELISDYRDVLQYYLTIKDKVGRQMLAIGQGEGLSKDRWGYSNTRAIEMVRDGEPTKVIIDDSSDEIEDNNRANKSDSIIAKTSFLGRSPTRLYLTDEEEAKFVPDPESMLGYAPVHPHVKCFDASNHEWIVIYSQNLVEYPWNKGLMDKLILPEGQKLLINMLMETTKVKHDDIVKGKMQGIVALATGSPGVGKTLTAEVFSEFIERPLYSIQCSQLGLSITDIEKNLSQALGRATRWNAILLIDEADVYIRTRGEDIVQNGIVGVFLRLIEYYAGIMFLTSNRGDIIDDAIISRATAWIKYTKPDEVLRKKLWEVLGANYGATFSANELESLANFPKFRNISGRTIRNLLKLAALLASRDQSIITPELLDQVSEYQMLD